MSRRGDSPGHAGRGAAHAGIVFDRVLVPLDGSSMAEAVLPVAEAIARRLDAELILVHALEARPPAKVHGEPHLATAEQARQYLESHRARLVAKGIRVEAHLEAGPSEDVAGSIEDLARSYRADLVVMCAHGRQAMRSRLIGPLAQHALGTGEVPILLRTADPAPSPGFDPRRILLAIDFEHRLGLALAAVIRFAESFGAEVTLLSVVEPAGGTGGWLLPGASELRRLLEAEDAGRRLRPVAEGLAERGVRSQTRVRMGDPGEAIVAEAKAGAADLIVLVSHGRAGFAAWYGRSLGQRLSSEAGLTLLLIRDPASR